MMFEKFSHFLAYGATDQQTMRNLSDAYDGLIVPGTIAAFQREGTGGFVLSLSASANSPPYFIDPRFPLFQTAQTDPKQSHVTLAEILGAPDELIRNTAPTAADFNEDLVQLVAQNWVDFNLRYEEEQAGKFKKYADRLDEEVDRRSASGPEGIIAPYLVADDDEWWECSKELYSATRSATPSEEDVFRVVAASSAVDLDRLLRDVEDEKVIVWVSGLHELEALPSQLAAYGNAIAAATARGQQCFALYGGFFSVVLSSVGLRGSCHGVGYGEHRNWPELAKSGPPLPRYYVPRFHRYINQDLAYQLWLRNSALTGCSCKICDEGPPVLSYHDLMQHSVFARQAEVEKWGSLPFDEAESQLQEEWNQLEDELESAELPEPLQSPANQATSHFSRWLAALEQMRED